MVDVDPNRALRDEQVWPYFRGLLEDSHGAKSHGSTLVVPSLADAFDTMSITRREYLAQHMLDVLGDALALCSSLETVHYNILSLATPYFACTDSARGAKQLLRAALEKVVAPASAVHWSLANIKAIARALATLERHDGKPDLWRQLYKCHEEPSPTGAGLFDVCIAGLLGCRLDDVLAFLDSLTCDEYVMARIEAYLPRMLEQFPTEQVRAGLQILSEKAAGPAGEVLRKIMQDAGIAPVAPLPASAQVIPFRQFGLASEPRLPPFLEHAYKALKLEETLWQEGFKELLAQDPLRVIWSTYSGIPELAIAQNQLIAEIEKLHGSRKEKVTKNPSSDFSELPSGQSESKYIYVFPTYLTEHKIRSGYGVIPYGTHRELGALIPYSTGFTMSVDTGHSVQLEELIFAALGTSMKFCCLQNYASHEIVWQIVNNSKTLRSQFKPRHIELASLPRGPRAPAIPNMVVARKDLIYLFDLAAFEAVKSAVKKLPALEGSRLVRVRHNLNIPVGVGCSRYAVEWLVDEHRWERIAARARELICAGALPAQLGKIGIEIDEPDDRPAPTAGVESPDRNVTKNAYRRRN